ncbi:MAG: flagellin, partial [Selenomonadaceae bacterium]|nr:flagellin [Selenomonadaceae bacterium]
MAMTVMHNAAAQHALGVLNKNSTALGKSLRKVSTGQKLNSAQDDASAYSISEQMRSKIRALEQDVR